MVVLNKKRIMLIVTSVFLSMFIFMLISTDEEDLKSTVSLPISGKIVVLDAGHGVPDERSSKFKWNNRG